jgi:uncharacterized protein YbjT (DUF2867 family)
MIVITGATGNTGRPAIEALLARGEKPRVIGRDARKLETFVQRGAEAVVADVQDAQALTNAFHGATAVYLVIPGALHLENFREYQECVSNAFAAAVAAARVPFAVTLSSIGAQHPSGTGPIVGLHNMEEKLNNVPGLNVLHLRAAYFMENLMMNIGTIRSMGMLAGGSPGDAAAPMIAAKDIGSYAAGRLQSRDFTGSSTQALLGPRDVTMNEVASIIGPHIGKPTLRYMHVPFLVLEPALIAMGLPKKSADLVIEMWQGGNGGLVAPERPRSAANTTPTTIEQFVTEVFAPAYNAKTTAA